MGKNLPAIQETRVQSLDGEDPPGEENGYPIQLFLPRKFHGQRSLVGYSLWGCKETRLCNFHSHNIFHNIYYIYIYSLTESNIIG